MEATVDATKMPISPLTPAQTLIIPAPTPLLLVICPPTCYGTRPENAALSRVVENPLAFPVESVAVEVRLLQADGEVCATSARPSSRPAFLPVDLRAYQAMFAADRDNFARADAEVITRCAALKSASSSW